ncbi:MAG: carbohydrate binding domain-containing protein, partial [Clostridia bacterium]|nr:carbohydrate binding domain-containing protein [Clostridia bacterium]
MKKRLFALIIALTFLISAFSSVGVLAAKDLVETNLLMNGDMELMGEASTFWNGITLETRVIHGGERSGMHLMEDPAKNKVATQTDIKGLIPGEVYTASAWVYAQTVLPTTRCKITVFGRNAEGKSMSEGSNNVEITPEKIGEWEQISCTFVAPQGIDTGVMRLWLTGGGLVYWDDAELTGNVTTEYKADLDKRKQAEEDVKQQGIDYMKKLEILNMEREAIEESEQIILNNGFETEDGTTPEGWIASGSSWGGDAFVVTDPEDVRTGNRAAKISSSKSSNLYIGQYVTDSFVVGQEYLFSAWVKVKEAAPLKGVSMKIEAYSDRNYRASVTNTGWGRSATYMFEPDGEWHQIKLAYTIPVGTDVADCLIIYNCPGEIIIDDVEMKVAAPKSALKLDTYRKFFYTDDPDASMFATIDNSINPIEPGNYVEFNLKDPNGNVVATDKVPASTHTTWNFKTEVMTEKQKAYTATATYYDAAGNLIGESNSFEIYKWDRPERMDKDGNFIDPLTGEIWYPSYGGSTQTFEDIEYMMSLGHNTFKMVGSFAHVTDEEYLQQLDWFQERGIKMLVALYHPPAGSPAGIKRLREVVTLVKDHPAMFGYMLMDEPTVQFGPAKATKTYEHSIDTITEGYKAIREIDSKNLVYCLESGGASVEQFKQTARCTDVFMIDPYPYRHDVVPTYAIFRIGRALEGHNGEYKQLTVVKAAAMGNANSRDYELGIVTGEAVRHQTYQALWIGAQEYGLIPATSGGGWQIKTSPFAKDIESLATTGEQQIVRDHFQGKNTTLFSNYQAKDVWMRSWIDASGQQYLALLNMTINDVDVDIPFTSINNKVTINNFTLTPVNGDTRTITGNDGRIKTTLSDMQVALYKVTT